LTDINGNLKDAIDPEQCWFSLEKDLRGPEGEGLCLVIELTKQSPGKPWRGGIFYDRPLSVEPDRTWKAARRGRRKDEEDTFLTSRGWLCSEMEQGQTDEFVSFRLVLDQKKYDECLEKVPYYKMWGLDVSSRYMKLFIRGDEPAPVLIGELEGNCIPTQCTMELTKITREVEGHKIAGTMETLPCLDVTIVKAPDSMYEWEDPLRSPEDMDQPQGSLEDYEEKQKMLQSGKLDEADNREDWTPDDWAEEQKVKADVAFKEKNYRDAIVYYTRALRYTPLNERVLSNRSAAYMKIDKHQIALDDANKAEEINPNWPKVFFRKGQALRGLKRFDDAISAFQQGQELDMANPEWDNEITRTKDAQEALAGKR